MYMILPDRKHIMTQLDPKDVENVLVPAAMKHATLTDAYEKRYKKPLKWEMPADVKTKQGVNDYAWGLQTEIWFVNEEVRDFEYHYEILELCSVHDIPSCWDKDVMDWLHPASIGPIATDADTMYKFVSVYGNIIRRSRETGIWRVFDGRQWRTDDNGTMLRWFIMVMEYYRNDAIEQKEALENGPVPTDKGEQKARESEIERLERVINLYGKKASVAYVTSMIEKGLIYFPYLTVSETDFDSHPEYVNFLNGTIDVRLLRIGSDGKIDRQSIKDAAHPHTPDDMQTHMIPYELDPAVPENEQFLKFVKEIHNDDPSLLETMQQSLGYAFTGYTAERTMWILHGEGDNGRSTFSGLIREIAGNYADTAPASLLLYNRNKNAYEASLMMGKLMDKRLVFINEPDISQNLDVAQLKSLTGGEDDTMARIMQKGYVSFKFHGKIFLLSNHLPGVNDPSNSSWKRIFQIPYMTQFTGRLDKKMPEKLREGIAYVLVWILEGAAKYAQTMEISRASSAVDATHDYREASDELGEFVSVCFEKDVHAYVVCIEAYQIYKKYCDLAQLTPLEEPTFRRRMLKRPGWKSKTRRIGDTIRVYPGWRERPNWKVPTYQAEVEAVEAEVAAESKIIKAVRECGRLTIEQIADKTRIHGDDIRRIIDAGLSNEIIPDGRGCYIIK